MNSAINSRINKLTIIEMQDTLIAFEKKEMSDAEHKVYDWILDTLEERMADDKFCEFLEQLEAAAA